MAWNKDLTDNEVDLLVQAFLLPPPLGFTEIERKQIFDWIKSPSIFVDFAEKRQKIILDNVKTSWYSF